MIREILVTIGEAVAWCGPHRILLCRPYQTDGCEVLSTGKQAHTLNSLLVQKKQVDEESNKFAQARLIVTSHEAIEINQ